MILLPTTPRRATLQSFWLACSLAGAMCFGYLSRGYPEVALCGFVAIVLVGFAGGFSPQFVSRPYRLWNRCARYYGVVAERVILRICYAAVMIPAGWTETSLRLRRPGSAESLWVSRRSLAVSLYQQLHSYPCSEAGDAGWMRRYITWARSSDQLWLLALLPFLCILLWLKNEEETVVRESIYTLF